jgi:3-oxoacyl-[acyl-carrier protein] reductase
MKQLEGKTVFVSGGTGYLGAEICRVCKGYGARVIFSYHHNEEKALALQKEIDGLAVQISLLDIGDIRTKIEGLYRDGISIDVLVNNAGVSQIMPLPLVEEEDMDWVMDINIKGMLFLTKHVLKGMVRNKKGVIVNIGSIAGSRMLDVPVTYAMTKAAVRGMTYSLASELKRFNIRVNCVEPGLLEGGVGTGTPESLRKDFIDHCAVGRAGTAPEIAEVVAFLASDRASYVNGQNIVVDGGV